jgi:hypothetical protein
MVAPPVPLANTFEDESSPSMPISSSPLRAFGKVTASVALNLMGALDLVGGKSRVSVEPAFVRSTRNWVMAGLEGEGVTVTTTIEFEVDLPQAVHMRRMSTSWERFAHLMEKQPASPA